MFRLDTHIDYLEKFTSYLTNNWACELGYFLPETTDSHDHHSQLIYPICDPLWSLYIQNYLHIKYIHTPCRISLQGDKLTHSAYILTKLHGRNRLKICTFQRHGTRYIDTDLLHSIYDVILHILYYDNHLTHFTVVHNPRKLLLSIKLPFVDGSRITNRYNSEKLPNHSNTHS